MVAQIFEVWIINLCTAAIDMFPVLKKRRSVTALTGSCLWGKLIILQLWLGCLRDPIIPKAKIDYLLPVETDLKQLRAALWITEAERKVLPL